MATKKTKTNSCESGNEQTARLAAEAAKIRAENERLKTDREILKKALLIRKSVAAAADRWTGLYLKYAKTAKSSTLPI